MCIEDGGENTYWFMVLSLINMLNGYGCTLHNFTIQKKHTNTIVMDLVGL